MSASREETPLGRYLIYLGLVAFFGVGALSYNLLCLLTQWLPASKRRQRWSRRIMIALLKTFIAAIQIGGVGRVRFRGVREAIPSGPSLIVANHTGLLDALFLLTELQDVVCVFKSSLRRSPFFCGVIRENGFIANDEGLDLLHAMDEVLARGLPILVFPEGTRTEAPPLNDFKAGFALVARRAGVPVRTLIIRNSCGLLGKGGGLLRRYATPFEYTFTPGPVFQVEDGEKAVQFCERIESFYRKHLTKSDFATWQIQRANASK
ncbi:lysophospholipid acyltransferase family protein [Cerasicoccus arenae]|uniref:1-acyl-sn-glycerol-3-phosphate acyltransferase n=1 Tax=Cerasicoccus arenae TaxID=424488 RepID=A0A8J3D9A5_9BACT|nr:lysophospholipid acyltransferase family protein [Cerasicoccus arenae]MBK1858320.1 1-acyl-sn-glycerol-3-phosphate acyltransferase [Cerasicoccus arenae]GHB90753.1 1-acyl-sn-glycerol-3-phosphate acyltransferase [Cerasicoccus arenae]